MSRHRPRLGPAMSAAGLLLFVAAEVLSDPRVDAGSTVSPVWPLDVRLEFRGGSFGRAVGEAGLEIADLDGDGKLEIIAAASGGESWPAQFFYAVSHRGASYRQTWVSPAFAVTTSSPAFSAAIPSLRVAEIDGDPAPEIVVGMDDQLHIFDGRTRERERVIQTTAWPTVGYNLQVANLDADGAPEIAFCEYDGLYIYDAITGLEEAAGILDGCDNLAVGNVDGDATPEIVLVSQFGAGYVLDGTTHAVQWAYPQGFGARVRLADMDRDGVAEIVATGGGYLGFRVFDAVAQVQENHIVVPGYPDEFAIADIEGDGPQEILYSGIVLDSTGVEKWRVDDLSTPVKNIAVGDTDGDGVREIVWGGRDQLVITDTGTHRTEWASLPFRGSFYGLAHGDLDADGRPEFLHTSWFGDSPTDSGRFLVYGAVNKRLRFVSPRPTDWGSHGFPRVRVVNVDADPQAEVLLTASDGLQGVLICYDGLTHEEQWRASVDESLVSLAIGDVDGDGELEAVVGSHHGIAPGTYIYVFDAETGALEWRSPDTQSGREMSLLRLAQLDADPALEILAAESGGRLFRFDRRSGRISVLAENVTALEAVDTNGDGGAEIVVGTWGGTLVAVDPVRRRRSRVIARFDDGRINGLVKRDLTGDGVADYAFGLNGRIAIADGRSASIIWQSEWIGRDVGAQDSLLVGDIDWDGRLELMVNTGNVGVDIYEVAAP